MFVAYFATRLRDIYFAITTLVFSQIFYVIIFTWTEVTGGENGLYFTQPPFTIPGIFSARFSTVSLHWFVLAIVALSYLALRRITQSPVRDGAAVDPGERAEDARDRVLTWSATRSWRCCSRGCSRGSPGPSTRSSTGSPRPDFVFFTVSGEVVIFNVMGGMGTLVGPVVGAAFFLLLREGLSRFWAEYYLIPLGIAFTLMVIFMPQGLLGFWKRRLNQ